MPRRSGNRIVKALESCIEQAKAARVAPEIIENMCRSRDMMVKKDEFTQEASSSHSKICGEIEEATYTRDWKADYDQGKTQWHFQPGMLCGQVEGQLLKSLVSIHRAKRVLEVGLFTGYSALSMAEALPADGEIYSLEICESLKPLVQNLTKDSPHAKKIKINSELLTPYPTFVDSASELLTPYPTFVDSVSELLTPHPYRITHTLPYVCWFVYFTGPALETMAKLADAGEQFDLMFLDGEKKDYVHLLEMSFDRNLLSPGGTVLIDNAYMIGTAYTSSDDTSPAHILKDLVKSRKDLHSVMLPMNDGVLMIRRLKDVERDTA
ncbi:O-methyltransferase [Plakobranchus ocellatus]|uniref:O-methyltransferase n=1 Tax=Plakobranchus ocellatus TaxID=259542 RepID=A0AAV4BKW2_9GAST|nr:O-methyltransferase [Plakobranchus ocellatus]